MKANLKQVQTIRKTWADNYPSILNLKCNLNELTATLSDGRVISVPVVWFKRLRKASLEQLQNFEIAFDGSDITWPKLDEDISIQTFIYGLGGSCC